MRRLAELKRVDYRQYNAELNKLSLTRAEASLTRDEAVKCGLCSGQFGGYDCPTDKWGGCTGCREHDV